MEYVKRLPEPTSIRFSSPDPFTFEPYSDDQALIFDKQRKSSNDHPSTSNDHPDGTSAFTATYKVKLSSKVAWSDTLPGSGARGQPSDTESIESRESVKSQETSPSASPMIPLYFSSSLILMNPGSVRQVWMKLYQMVKEVRV